MSGQPCLYNGKLAIQDKMYHFSIILVRIFQALLVQFVLFVVAHILNIAGRKLFNKIFQLRLMILASTLSWPHLSLPVSGEPLTSNRAQLYPYHIPSHLLQPSFLLPIHMFCRCKDISNPPTLRSQTHWFLYPLSLVLHHSNILHLHLQVG